MSCIIRRLLRASVFTIAPLVLGVPAAFAQYSVQGTVVDEETDSPLSGAHVFLPRLHRGTVTDSAGAFTLSGLAPGTWKLEFSRVGYEKQLRVVTPGDGEPSILAIRLTPRTVMSGEVVILAEDPRHPTDVPQFALSVDHSDRLESGRMSLWEYLEGLPGFARSTNGPGIERPFIRGLSAGRILLMTQGLPYAYQTWDPEAGLSTNGNGTEQIDVILGPATLRYGPGAMGGIIHLTPEYPAPQGRMLGSYTGGLYSNSEGLYSELALKQTTGHWFWGARGSFDSHADYKAERDEESENEAGGKRDEEGGEEEGRVPNSRYDHLHGQVFGGTSRDWGSSRLTYQFLRHRNGIVEAEEDEEGPEEETEREIMAPYHSLMDHIVTSDTDIQVGKGWVHAIIGFQMNEQAEYEPAGEAGREEKGEAAMELKLTTLHTRIDYATPLANGWSITTGVQGALQEGESEGEEPFVPSSEKRQLGLFGLAKWEHNALLVEGGLRYDVQSLETSPAKLEAGATPLLEGEGPTAEIERDYGLLSGSLGGTYRIADGRYVKVNLGAGNRAPDVAELTANGLLREVRRFLVGDEELDAEYNLEADVTVGWELEAATVSVGGFVNQINHYTYLFASGEVEEGYPVYLYRQADATFKGGHAGIVIHPSGAKGLQLFSRVDFVFARLDGGIDAPMIPAPHLTNGIEVQRSSVGPLARLTLRAELDTFLEQNRVAPWESSSEGYSLANASVNAYLPFGNRTITIGLHGLNLLNKRYVSHLSLLKEDGIPNMGRSVNLTVSVPFGG